MLRDGFNPRPEAGDPCWLFGSGFTALAKDPSLAQHHITLEFGYTKNPKKKRCGGEHN